MTATWHVGVDIGGTFTDIVAVNAEDGESRYLKVPSSREDPASAVIRGIDALHDEEGVPPGQLRLVMHGTTLATNAIIERKLARTALVTTKGFRDVLEIARTWRTELYDPFFDQAPPLIPRELRFEADERIDAQGEVIRPLREQEIARLVESLREADVEAVAVAFLHSYRNPDQEDALTTALRNEGRWFVCGSAELLRELREYERTATTVLNTALMPLIEAYLTQLEGGLAASKVGASLFVSQSNGGAQTPQLARERPVSLALSGPAAGVVALVDLATALDRRNLIGLDMGGTSADVSLVSDYQPRYTTELSVGELPVRLTSIRIDAIGAGGGSLATVDVAGTLRVGPESAGANPGPAAYAAGGTRPTVTDSQLVLGRLSADAPLAGRLFLRHDLATCAITAHLAEPLGLEVADVAAGVVEVTNASMERAVRVALRNRGDDPRDFTLVAFGGAGPLHACELAQSLDVPTVVIPPRPGTMCAVGLVQSDVRLDFSVSEIHRSDDSHFAAALTAIFDGLATRAHARFAGDPHLASSALEIVRTCDVRYLGQAYEVAVPVPEGAITEATVAALTRTFHELHERAYAFSEPGELCEIVTCRLTASTPLDSPRRLDITAQGTVSAVGEREVYELGRGFQRAPIYERSELPAGHVVRGPAVIQQTDATTWLPSYAHAEVVPRGDLVVTIEPTK